MARRDRGASVHLYLTPEFKQTLDQEAETFDVATSSMVTAVMRGAIKLGQIPRLFEVGAPGMGIKRRPRVPLRWKPEGERVVAGNAPGPARTWKYGPWTLDRITSGYVNANRRKEGEGWYLTGPDTEPVLVGWKRREAMDRAAEVIRQWERTHAQDEGRQEVGIGEGGEPPGEPG